MLAIEMTLLGGRYRASSFEDRRRPEWPPDPARLFYAAVHATYNAPVVDEAEVEVLRWWETLAAPEIACSGARLRAVVDHYVPGNAVTSWVRDLQGQWQDLAAGENDLAAARAVGDEHGQKKAERALDKHKAKLVADTQKSTRATGKESAQVMANVLQVLPEHRGKQARTFPAAIPDRPVVHFIWSEAEPDTDRRRILDAILGRIARVGHSSSAVSCRITDSPGRPELAPTKAKRSEYQLRTTAPGLLDTLIEEHTRHGGYRERILPALLTGYAPVDEPATVLRTQNEMGNWIVLRFQKRQQLSLSRTLDISRSVRGALISHAQEPVPAVISGHAEDGTAVESKSPHISVLVLPNVTNVYSDGYIQAIAIGLPEDIGPADLAAVMDALHRWSEDTDGYDLRLPGGTERRLVEGSIDAGTFHPSSGAVPVASRQFWARKHDDWSSVTPVALDRHPRVGRNPDFDELAAAIAPIVASMCSKSGLPSPAAVFASPVSSWFAAPPVNVSSGQNGRRGFPQYCVGGRRDKRRYTTHLTIRFDEPVQGPLVIGAGRYFGYGLMLPSPGSRKGAK